MKKIMITSLFYNKETQFYEVCLDKNIYLEGTPVSQLYFIIPSMIAALTFLEGFLFSIKESGRNLSKIDECFFLAFLSRYDIPLIDEEDDDDLAFFESMFPTLSSDLPTHRMEVLIEARIDSIIGWKKLSHQTIHNEFKKKRPQKRKLLVSRKAGIPERELGKPNPRSDS